MSSKIVITGGSGFIGSAVVQMALKRGFEIRNLDLKPPALREHNELWRSVDVREEASVAREVQSFQPDLVLHLASDIDVNLIQLEQYRTTIEGTRNVVTAAANLKSLKRFVHVSTQFVVTPGVVPKSETDFKPYTLYGEAKASSEKIVRNSAISDFVILRPTIIWGPNHPSFADQIWHYIAQRKYLHPMGSEAITRCYGYVTNTADQIMTIACAALSSDAPRVYYLGDGTIDYDVWADAFSFGLTGKPARRIPVKLLSVLSTVGELAKWFGLSAPIDRGRFFRMTTSSDINLEPTFNVVGQPKVPFEQGVAETLAWLSNLRNDRAS